jgi:hypothetical protein
LCSDAHGDVFIANMGAGTVEEFAHGGTNPINTYSPGGAPIGCAVNPVNGDLAVSNFSAVSVSIYAPGHPNNPTVYAAPTGFTAMYYLGYDNAGNLYMDGVASAAFAWAELPLGSASISALLYSGPPIATPGGVQWKNAPVRVLIGDQTTNKIYKIKLNGTLGGTLILGSCPGSTIVQFVKRGPQIVGPDSTCGTADVYPAAGGAFIPPAIGPGLVTPVGSAISPP